ncbi:hypothetical protein GGF43_002144 [Coemansia sp. RSA 2618]|nr:hypothetical protein GGF43_002144 [Coemansia sp. RSA 2618]
MRTVTCCKKRRVRERGELAQEPKVRVPEQTAQMRPGPKVRGRGLRVPEQEPRVLARE